MSSKRVVSCHSASLLLSLFLFLGVPAIGCCEPTPRLSLAGLGDEGPAHLHAAVRTSHGTLHMRWMHTPGGGAYDGAFSVFYRGRWLVDGARPWAEFYESLGVAGRFDFPGYSVVVFEGWMGGNNNPPSYVAVVLTRRGARVVRTSAFDYVLDAFVMKRRPHGVFLDFGFRHRVRHAYLVNRHGLVPLPQYHARDATQLSAEQCDGLRDIVLSDCLRLDSACDFLTPHDLSYGVIMFSQNTSRFMRWVRQHPAYGAPGFAHACQLACRTHNPDQVSKNFEPAVCHRRPGTMLHTSP